MIPFGARTILSATAEGQMHDINTSTRNVLNHNGSGIFTRANGRETNPVGLGHNVYPAFSPPIPPTPSFPNASVGNPRLRDFLDSRQGHSGMTGLVRGEGVKAGFATEGFGNDGVFLLRKGS